MSDELWETIDWGDDDDDDDDDDDTINQDRSMVLSTIDRKDTAGTVRLSGASTASESVDTPSLPTTSRKRVVEVQKQRDKRGSWFDFEDELEVEQAFSNHSGANRFQRCKTDPPTRNATSRSLRVKRRQSDYTIEKNRALERRSAAKKSSEEREEHTSCRSFTWTLQKKMNSALRRSRSARLAKNAEETPVPDEDDGLDVPFPSRRRRQSCEV
jgi:hypothetical protein